MALTAGDQFFNSLNDGRTVWLNGSKTEDLSSHPAFKGTLQTIKKLTDALEDERTKDIIGYMSPTTKKMVHKSFLIPKTIEQLVERRNAFSLWSKQTYGVMSRLSEYARSLVTGWYIDRENFDQYDPTFSKKITSYYEKARDEHRFITTAILDPQIDRSKSSNEITDKDALLRVIKETEDGVIVRGAKMIATAAPYSHDVIIMPHQKLNNAQTEYANMFIVPLHLPGIQIICRESFASENHKKHRISSQFDEMDAVLVFDDVLIPWERVFIYRNVEGVYTAQRHQQLNDLANHQTVVRLLTKLEFVTGVAISIAESIGVDRYLHVQEKLGELITQIESIDALLLASEIQGSLTDKGVYLPSRVPLQTARNLGTRYYSRAIEILQLIGAGGFIQLPSTDIDENDEILPYIKKYYKGANVEAAKKTRLFQLGWELIGSPLGSRHTLYERFYSGDPIRTYAMQYDTYNKESLKRKLEHFWENCKTEERVRNEFLSETTQ